MALQREFMVYVCSDSIGDTADAVARATIRQFVAQDVKIKRYAYIKYEDEIQKIVEEAGQNQAFIVYTLVQPDLREMMKEEAIQQGVRAVDIMGPMMQAFIETFNDSPTRKPGLLHALDEDYYRRVEAVEFSVKCDDGKDTRNMLNAHIVIIGVSRTSKTPLSIYLAHKGYKVANLPLVPEVKLPAELFQIPSHKIIGLTIDADKILKIRTARLKSVGLPPGAKYASLERISEELEYGHALMKQLGCAIIDVTDKAIEETAGMVLAHFDRIN